MELKRTVRCWRKGRSADLGDGIYIRKTNFGELVILDEIFLGGPGGEVRVDEGGETVFYALGGRSSTQSATDKLIVAGCPEEKKS